MNPGPVSHIATASQASQTNVRMFKGARPAAVENRVGVTTALAPQPPGAGHRERGGTGEIHTPPSVRQRDEVQKRGARAVMEGGNGSSRTKRSSKEGALSARSSQAEF